MHANSKVEMTEQVLLSQILSFLENNCDARHKQLNTRTGKCIGLTVHISSNVFPESGGGQGLMSPSLERETQHASIPAGLIKLQENS